MAERGVTRTTRSRRVEAGIVLAALLAASVAAWATGFAPFTGDDSASVPRGGTVSVLANGQASVLANDLDLEGDPLTAELAGEPQRGTVALNADGTFLYSHDGSQQGEDQFRYRAFDGTLYSRVTHVRITITEPAIPPQIVSQRYLEVAEEGALEIRVEDLVVLDPDSRFPQDFTLALDDGENYSLTGTGTTVQPDADFNGTLEVPTRVNDGQADSNTFPLKVEVAPVNDAPVAGAPLPAQEATEASPFELEVGPVFSDVDPGDSLIYTATGLPPSGALTLNPSSGSLSGTPQLADVRPEPYSITVTATDTGGASASTVVSLTIEPAEVDLAVAASVEPDPATFGVSPRWTIEIENLGNAGSPRATLSAQWFSAAGFSSGGPLDPPALTLSAPAACTITDNATSHVTIDCELESVPQLSTTSLVMQSTQQAPGDVTLVAQLTAEGNDASDADANDTASASLSLAGRFNESPAQLLEGGGTGLAVGDLDADGLLDVAAVGDRTRVFYNTGQRTLEAGPVLGAGSAGNSIALLDWDGDGLLDIAVADDGRDAVSIYVNDGQRGFVLDAEVPLDGPRSMAALDADGNDVDELFVAGSGGTLVVERDLGARAVHSAPARHVSGADLNGDGFDDLVITDADTRAVHVLTSNGSAFSASTSPGHGRVASTEAHDADGDGAADLLLAVHDATSEVPANVILRNGGNGEFGVWAAFGAAPTAQLLGGDVNGDGYPDLVVLNESGVHQVHMSDSQGQFALQDEFLLTSDARHGRLADIDADGWPDLILGGEGSPTIGFYRNDGTGRFGAGDVTAPVLTLLGEPSVEVQVGGSYTDAGATAMDDVEGDLTSAIVVDNPVDAAVIGTYVVTYSVQDRSGNSADPVERTVTVVPAAETGGGGGGAAGYLLAGMLMLAWLWRRRRTLG
jgi:hypothetical protein